jgi:hypothetical protein
VTPAPDEYRKLVTDAPLDLELVDVEAAVSRARWCTGIAFDLLLEDELALLAAGEKNKIFLGLWLSTKAGIPRRSAPALRKRLQAVVAGVVRSSLEAKVVPEIAHVQALAAIALDENGEPLDRTHLLQWSPRAQLLVPLVAALLSLDGRLPALGAWAFSTHGDQCGEGAEAYGTDKQPGQHACERLLTLDVTGGDAHGAVAMIPMVTGTRDDASVCSPKRLEEAQRELIAFAMEPPSTPADHLEPLFAFVRAVRDLVVRAIGRGSRALRLAEISARKLLDSGVPSLATLGPLSYGPLVGPGDLHAPRYWAGTDAAALRAANRHQVPLLALAFDSGTLDGGEIPGLERLVLNKQMLAGRDLAEMLSSPTRLDELPALDEPPAAALDGLSDHSLAARLGIQFDHATETALTLPSGHAVLGARGNRPMSTALLLHSTLSGQNPQTPTGTLAWTTNFDLNEFRSRDRSIIIAKLHRLTLQPVPPLGDCTARLFRTYPLHGLKPGAYKTRCYLRVVAMMANLVVIGEGRSTQALIA